MREVVGELADRYGQSHSVPNFSGKLQRGTLRYCEAAELAEVLGYNLYWKKQDNKKGFSN